MATVEALLVGTKFVTFVMYKVFQSLDNQTGETHWSEVRWKMFRCVLYIMWKVARLLKMSLTSNKLVRKKGGNNTLVSYALFEANWLQLNILGITRMSTAGDILSPAF